MEELFVRGVEEFNRQFFFEAHDTWEEIWRETSGLDRIFYQGLIHTAVGFYHLGNENWRGAMSQFDKGLRKLEQYLPQYLGVRTELFVEGVRECFRDVESVRAGAARKFDARKIPQITWM